MRTIPTTSASSRSSRSTTSAISSTMAATTPWIPATRSPSSCSRTATTAAVMGIPKTIDNDLAGTDHCPGVRLRRQVHRHLRHGSVLRRARLRYRHDHHHRVHGPSRGLADRRRRRWAGVQGLRPPTSSTSPRWISDLDDFTKKVKDIYEQNKNCIVAVSEGIHDKDGTFIAEYANKKHGQGFLRPRAAGRSGGLPRQPRQAGHRRQGARHRTFPAAALRGALRLPDRHRRILHGRQGPPWRMPSMASPTRWSASSARWWTASTPARSSFST